MERKKIMTMVLLVAVALIWGTVILKVVRGTRPAGNPASENPPEAPVARQMKDSLRLDYRDPFIGEFVRERQAERRALPQNRRARKEPEAPPVPDFTFKGMIGNGDGTKAMILKNGNLHMLGVGEIFGGFKVIGISPELVTVQSGRHQIEVKVR